MKMGTEGARAREREGEMYSGKAGKPTPSQRPRAALFVPPHPHNPCFFRCSLDCCPLPLLVRVLPLLQLLPLLPLPLLSGAGAAATVARAAAAPFPGRRGAASASRRRPRRARVAGPATAKGVALNTFTNKQSMGMQMAFSKGGGHMTKRT